MGKITKLHRRLIKKRSEISAHKKAVHALLIILGGYADHRNWKETDESRDVVKNGIVIGVQRLMAWVGPGVGPEMAESIIGKIKK